MQLLVHPLPAHQLLVGFRAGIDVASAQAGRGFHDPAHQKQVAVQQIEGDFEIKVIPLPMHGHQARVDFGSLGQLGVGFFFLFGRRDRILHDRAGGRFGGRGDDAAGSLTGRQEQGEKRKVSSDHTARYQAFGMPDIDAPIAVGAGADAGAIRAGKGKS